MNHVIIPRDATWANFMRYYVTWLFKKWENNFYGTNYFYSYQKKTQTPSIATMKQPKCLAIVIGSFVHGCQNTGKIEDVAALGPGPSATTSITTTVASNAFLYIPGMMMA